MDLRSEDGSTDQFPVGMRVLAVDDDPACLTILAKLLRICKYEVTTVNEATSALKILKENRNKYDLVISDVDMPRMDGFKLLELVSVEMNLPVIMLSAHGSYDFVMKGITHGACDYLLKPVRLEELKIIWQHVIRKQKLNPRDDQNSTKINMKIYDKSEDDEEEEEEKDEESGQDYEDSCTQKKPRVVWTSELHQKFVDAVHQLGPDKAVPKKILDLMDVEGLTRENVASHLQKFRLYLKKMNDEANRKNSSYFHIGQFDEFRDFHSLGDTRQLPNSALSSYPQAGTLDRFNSSSGSLSNFPVISSSGFIQAGNYQNLANSVSPFGKHQSPVLPSTQNGNPFLPNSTLLEPNRIGERAGFVFGSGFPDSKTALGSSIDSSTCALSNPLMLQPNHQQTHQSASLGNQSSLLVASLSTGSLDRNLSGSSDFLGSSSCNGSRNGTAKLARFSSSRLSTNQNVNKLVEQCCDISGQDYNHVLNNSFRNMGYLVSTSSVMMDHSKRRMPCNVSHAEVEKAPSVEPKLTSDRDIPLEQTKSDDGFIHNNHDALDNIMHEMLKQGENGMMSMANDFGFDAFHPGSCL